jgi:hypothetical protein
MNSRLSRLTHDALSHLKSPCLPSPFAEFPRSERVLAEVAKLLLIFAALYLSELSAFPLSIDEEIAAFRNDAAVWVAQGRWVTYLIETFLLPQPTVPYLPLGIFGVASAISYILLVRAHGDEELTLKHYALFPLFSAFPMWFFIIEFYTNLPTVAVGLVSSCISIYLFGHLSAVAEHDQLRLFEKKFQLIVASLGVAVAIGSYQSFIFFFLSAGAGVALVNWISHKQLHRLPWRSLMLLALLSAAGAVLYQLIWKIFLAALGVQVDAYLQSLLNYGLLLNDPALVLKLTFSEILKIYGGSKQVYGQNSPFYLLGFGCVIAIALHLRHRGLLAVVCGFGLIGIVVLAPFILHPLSRGFVAYRSLVAIPYVIWLCGALILGLRNRPLRVAGLALVALTAFESLYTLSLFQAANYLVRDHDRLLAQQIYSRIAAAHPNFDVNRPYSVEFYGAKSFQAPYPRVASSTVGHSFFEWDLGNPQRIVLFMNMLGYANLTQIPGDRRPELIAELNIMPVWPNEGSVKVVQGVTLVRLGKEPGIVHQNLSVPFLPSGENVLFRLRSPHANPPIATENAEIISANSSLRVATATDAQILIPLNEVRAQSCSAIQVTISEETEKASMLQVFYRQAGEGTFSEANSSKVQIPQGKTQTSIFLEAPGGFEPILRIDPVTDQQIIGIHDIAVGCLRPL